MRETCLICFRPCSLCLCARIPKVDNATKIVVLQHKRERFHPFGSARMLMQSLNRGRLEVVHGDDARCMFHPMDLPSDTGLLYPRPEAKLLHTLPAAERPSTLLLLDGTWSHAHRMYRDNPWMEALPHYAIAPKRKSRYLVRKEPKDHCLSTLEAAVEALQGLEPALDGLDALLEIFETMNVEQVAQRARSAVTPRVLRVKQRPPRTIPKALLDDAAHLVLVHAECAAVQPSTENTPGTPPPKRASELFQGVALRVATGELFSTFVAPPSGEPTDRYLSRAGLQRDQTTARLSYAKFVREFQGFLKPADVLATWNRGVFGLLPAEVVAGRTQVQLKAAYCNARGGPCGPLAGVVAKEGLDVPVNDVPGRVGVQLRHMAAIARFLGELDGRGRARIA